MIETTKEKARMDTTRHHSRRLGRWAVPAGMAALCTTVVLGMGAAAGAATAPTGECGLHFGDDDAGAEPHGGTDRGQLDPEHDVLRDRHRDRERGGRR
jgi:hypothetical protein